MICVILNFRFFVSFILFSLFSGACVCAYLCMHVGHWTQGHVHAKHLFLNPQTLFGTFKHQDLGAVDAEWEKRICLVHASLTLLHCWKNEKDITSNLMPHIYVDTFCNPHLIAAGRTLTCYKRPSTATFKPLLVIPTARAVWPNFKENTAKHRGKVSVCDQWETL